MIKELTPEERVFAKELLSEYHLPTDDIFSENVRLYGYFDNDNFLACVGLEEFDDAILLRSLAVKNQQATCGIGTKLTEFIGRYAYQQDKKPIYLLTDSADGFFSRIGYKQCERLNAPESIRNTKQFSELCADASLLMKLEF